MIVSSYDMYFSIISSTPASRKAKGNLIFLKGHAKEAFCHKKDAFSKVIWENYLIEPLPACLQVHTEVSNTREAEYFLTS